MKPEYLGDGVYAVYDGNGIELRANDPINPTDVIYIESFVLDALNNFVKNLENNCEE